MSILSLAILIIATILAAYSFELRDKLSTAKRQVEKTEQILKDTMSENCRLQKSFREIAHYSRIDFGRIGKWEMRFFGGGVMVGKFSPTGDVLVVARWYQYTDTDEDEHQYLANCAEELLEKLTEEV